MSVEASSNKSHDNLKSPQVIYQIDRHDRIKFVNTGWRQFALQNENPRSASDYVGHNVWGFMDHDDGAVTLFRQVTADVRATGQAVYLSFVCDSPVIERDMEMSIIGADNGDIIFFTQEVASRPARNSKPLVAKQYDVCDGCHRVRTEAGWRSIMQALIKSLITIDRTAIKVRRTTCETCDGLPNTSDSQA